jgi:hypothetical protein
MIAFTAVVALVLLLLSFGWYAARDLFRQTARWSGDHGSASRGPASRPSRRRRGSAEPADRWTALDELQLGRLLDDRSAQR